MEQDTKIYKAKRQKKSFIQKFNDWKQSSKVINFKTIIGNKLPIWILITFGTGLTILIVIAIIAFFSGKTLGN